MRPATASTWPAISACNLPPCSFSSFFFCWLLHPGCRLGGRAGDNVRAMLAAPLHLSAPLALEQNPFSVGLCAASLFRFVSLRAGTMDWGSGITHSGAAGDSNLLLLLICRRLHPNHPAVLFASSFLGL